MLFVPLFVEERLPSKKAAIVTKKSTKECVMDELEEMTGCRPDPSFISDRGNDLCVRCGKDSEVSALRSVESRPHHVGGMGQFCEECFAEK